jgi:hypothetical protein
VLWGKGLRGPACCVCAVQHACERVHDVMQLWCWVLNRGEGHMTNAGFSWLGWAAGR